VSRAGIALEVVVVTPDHQKHKTDTVERCNAELVTMADAVVIVGELDWELRKLRAGAMGKRIPVRVVFASDTPETDECHEPRDRGCG
jgi:hypothetical protein